MLPSARLAWIAAAACGASLLAVAWPALRPLILALDGAVVLALVYDCLATPAPARFGVERRAPERTGLSRVFERELSIDAPRAAGRWIEIHERAAESLVTVGRTLEGARDLAPPDVNDPSGGPERLRLPAGGRARSRRAYRPGRRGVQQLGALAVVVHGPLGLVSRRAEFGGGTEIAVEPALATLRRTLELAASERWMDLGARRLKALGGQSEFESLREYVAGDDPRTVDWKATARRGRVIVRQYQVERGQELILLVDAGFRMRPVVGAGEHAGWTKLDFALDAALEIAAVAVRAGDRVGGGAFRRELVSFAPPVRGARALEELRQRLFALQAEPVAANLGAALRELAARHRRRAVVLVLSDVADAAAAKRQADAVRSAARGHRVIFAALDEPELRAAAAGEIPEDVARVYGAAAVRGAALAMARDRAEALASMAASGCRALSSLPAELAGPLLAAWLDERTRL